MIVKFSDKGEASKKKADVSNKFEAFPNTKSFVNKMSDVLSTPEQAIAFHEYFLGIMMTAHIDSKPILLSRAKQYGVILPGGIAPVEEPKETGNYEIKLINQWDTGI